MSRNRCGARLDEMSQMRIDWMLLYGLDAEPARVGDLISADAGGLPAYRVVALDGGLAHLRDEEHSREEISPLSRFRWKARPSAS
jgi:hypothetical protein